jgi:hypothetical protein
MNVYNYIYTFFCRFWGNKVGNGRIIGAAHVTFALLMHMLFFSEVVRSTSLQQAVTTEYENVAVLRDAYWLFIAVLVLVVYFIYTPERTYRLIKEYNVRYAEDLLGNILRILFYIIIPTVVGVLLALYRNRAFV